MLVLARTIHPLVPVKNMPRLASVAKGVLERLILQRESAVLLDPALLAGRVKINLSEKVLATERRYNVISYNVTMLFALSQ
jgi:hypothetical protein